MLDSECHVHVVGGCGNNPTAWSGLRGGGSAETLLTTITTTSGFADVSDGITRTAHAQWHQSAAFHQWRSWLSNIIYLLKSIPASKNFSQQLETRNENLLKLFLFIFFLLKKTNRRNPLPDRPPASHWSNYMNILPCVVFSKWNSGSMFKILKTDGLW